ncbi:MAG TPA: polysaccharide biosynthesis tyrosine autokinase [Bryobacteraceae bacterium]
MSVIEQDSFQHKPNTSAVQPPSVVTIDPPWNGQTVGAARLLPPVHEPIQRSLSEYRHLLWRKKGFILTCVLSGVLLGGIVTIYEAPTYIASTTLEFQPRTNTSPVRQQTVSEVYDESAIATYEHVLQSRSLREKVVKKLQSLPTALRTASLPASPSLLLQMLAKTGLNGAVAPRPPTYKSAVLQASKTLTAKVIPETRIVKITCESAIATVAAAFANNVVSEFMDEDLQSHWNSTQSTNKQLRQELQQLKARMEQSEGKLSQYAQKTGITFASASSTLVDAELQRTQQDLAAAENDRVAKEARYKIALASFPNSFASVVPDPVLDGYRTQITDLERQLANLGSTFTPAYYKIKQIRAQIVEVQAAAAKERQTMLDRIKDDYDESMRRESMLAAEYRRHLGTATSESQRVLQYNMLKNDFDANRQLYESVLQSVKELDITSAVHANNIRIIDAAVAASAPARPNPVHNLGFGLFTGLLLSVGFVFWKDHASMSVWAPGEGPTLLSLPELGVIPSSKCDKHTRSLTKPGIFTRALALRTFQPADVNGALVAWQQPSLMAESFRRTVASILFSANGRLHPKVIVVTSPGQGDGKSMVSSNLAVAFAEIKLRVLLVDCDLRKPTLHRVFDVANTWGISNILEENTVIDALPSQALGRDTAVAGLQLLSSGPATISVSQLMFSERLGGLLARCRKDFDVIIVDTPPLLHVADARAISRYSDGVVLVLRAGSSKLRSAVASIQVLMQDGSPILGTVLNDWNPRSGGGEQFYEPYYESSSRSSVV